MLRPFPQYLRRDRRLRQRRHARTTTRSSSRMEQRRWHGLIVNVNYTFSRTEDDLAARTGYDFAQDWAVGVNDQPHIFNVIAVYDLPFGKEGQPGSGNGFVGGAGPRLAALGDHAVPIGPAARLDHRRLQPAERRHVLRRLQPELLGPGPHQRRLRRRRRARHDAAHLHRPQRVRVGAGRSPTATRRARSPTICATRTASTRT